MTTSERQLEILAPVGSVESFYAAVNAKADAVYLGLDNFNARAKAEGFNENNISDIVNYAHLFDVKVYITVNTLIKDSEIDDFIKMVEVCYNAHVDAFITQDLGMGMLIKKLFPNITLHASTQMGIHNLDGAKFIEKLGYKRVILSREARLEDIIDIKNNTNLEIEYFVQGALCVCFSGNCYLSSIKDGNSGNRGKCHQLCRLKYKFNGISGYFLSPKDLCLIDNLQALIDAGVGSFKIEGRLKRPSYVAACVKAYRLALLGKDTKQALSDIQKCFSRGSYNTSAYLNGNDNIINDSNSSEIGTKIGKVIKVEPFKNLYKVTIESRVPLNSGDGLRIMGTNVTTLGIGNATQNGNSYSIITNKQNIEKGSEVFKTTDIEFEKAIISPTRKLKVDFDILAYANEPLKMTLTCKGLSINIVGEPLNKADNRPIDKLFIKNQIKFDNLPFEIGNITFETDGVFIAKSQFNKTRRQAIAKLFEKLTYNTINKTLSEEEVREAKQSYINSFNNFNNSESYIIIDEATKDYPLDKNIIFSPKNYDNRFIEGLIRPNGKIFLDLPIVATKKDIKKLDEFICLLDDKFKCKVGIVANNYYALKYLNKRPIIIGTGLNVYNTITAGVYAKLSVYDIIASPETVANEKLLSYRGNLPLMTMVHCPYKHNKLSSCEKCSYNLSPIVYTDERGNRYRITRKKVVNCQFELRFDDNNLYNRLLPQKNSRNATDLRK